MEQLHFSEQKYRSLAENMTDGIYLISSAYRLIYCNSAMEEIFGRPRQFFAGNYFRNLMQCIHPSDRTMVQDVFFASGQTCNQIQAGYRIVRPDGDIRYVRDVLHLVRDENTETFHFQGIVSDLTAIRQAEEMLRVQTRREIALNRVIRAIHNSLDIETIFKTATAEIADLVEVDRANVAKYLPDRDVWINVAEHRRSPDIPSVRDLEIANQGNPLAEQLRQGKIVCLSDYATCTDGVNQSLAQTYPGARLMVPIHVNSVLWGSLTLCHLQVPWQWSAAEIELGTTVANQLAIAIQQSELYQRVQQLNKTLETQVQERTAKLQRTLNFESVLKRIIERIRDNLDETKILQTAIDELADKLAIPFANTILYEAISFSQQSDDALAVVSEHNAIAPELSGLSLPALDFPEMQQQLLQGVQMQFCVAIKAYRNQWMTVLLCPLLDENNQLLGDMLLLRDKDQFFDEAEVDLVQQVSNQCAIAIRQARLYEAAQAQVVELERLNRLKDDFLSTVSHELRTPMSNIKMSTHMLEISLKQQGILNDQSTSVSRYFQILKDECQRETRLIDNLLDLSRLDAQTDPLMISTVEMPLWLPYVIEPFLERIQEQQQTLTVRVPETLPPLVTDVSYLERILSELINNACKYTPVGEQVMISAMTPKQGMTVSVTNTGAEIPQEECDRIFDRFYRIPSNDPWKHSGTGLGLALVKKLVETLQGSISVRSGSGETTFSLWLPLKLESEGANGYAAKQSVEQSG